MKLPQILKLAVEKSDWKLVCAAYTAITGEALSPPEPPKPKTPDFLNLEVSEELLQQLGISNSQEDYGPPSNSDEEVVADKDEEEHFFIAPAKRRDFQAEREDGKKEARKEEIRIPQERSNRFVDDLDVEAADLKANNKVLADVYSKVKSHANRSLISDANPDTAKKINVECSLCHTHQSVSPVLAKGWNINPDDNTYKCNACCTPSGRTKAMRANREEELSGSSRRKRK